MSELIKRSDDHAAIRWKLLTGVSALALAYSLSFSCAHAEDADRPTLWLELGGQLSSLEDRQEIFEPTIMGDRPSIFEPSQKFEGPPRSSIDEFGKLSLHPRTSNWTFSASVQYGRSNSHKRNVQQTSPVATSKYFLSSRPPTPSGKVVVNPAAERFADTKTYNSEQHLILDFQAGRDVGLGLFGGVNGTSSINLGVRIAQFRNGSNFAFKSDPDWHFQHKYISYLGYHLHVVRQPFHSNIANLTAERSFHGIGPSLSWNSSVPIVGNVPDGEVVVDWGVSVALLFGRQKTRTHHQSTARYGYTSGALFKQTAVPHTTARFPSTPDHARSRNVIVPNLGATVGLSWRLQDLKVSLGYKADFFFGAMDGGIDARKSYDRNFYGPFASVSIGLGG